MATPGGPQLCSTQGLATAGPLNWPLVLILLALPHHQGQHLLAQESLRRKSPGLEGQLTSLFPPPPPPSWLLLGPSREVRPRQNSLSELNNKRKHFSGPGGPRTSSGQLRIRGYFLSRREGLSLSPEARAEEMGQD